MINYINVKYKRMPGLAVDWSLGLASEGDCILLILLGLSKC